MPKWTTKCMEQTRYLTKRGKTYNEIAAALGGHWSPEYVRKRHNAYKHKRRAGYAAGYSTQNVAIYVSSCKVNLDAIAERDRAFAAGYSSITAMVVGDPLPGRSALDRRLA